MIRVLVVDDLLVASQLLRDILESDPEIEVVGMARNGKEAIQLLSEGNIKPDVITMDIHMPVMNGLEATRAIMETDPVPIVIISSSWHPDDVQKTFLAFEAGVLACLEKPWGLGHPDHKQMAKQIIQTVKAMAGVGVVKRRPSLSTAKKVLPVYTAATLADDTDRQVKLVVIGASTGGPPVIHKILKGLNGNISSVPILIVQHISVGFIQGMADWLTNSTGFTVHIAKKGDSPLPGHVYLAPDDHHMGVSKAGQIELSKDPPMHNSLRPSVSYLFRTVAQTFGKNAIGVLLTGMGVDGAEELRVMKSQKAITIVQDEKSSIVHGMPGEAIKLGGATYILPPEQIVQTLITLLHKID